MKPTFDAQREIDEQRGDEYAFGSVQKDLAQVPVTDRIKYSPDGVLQFNNVMDTFGCASRGPLNILETKLNYLYATTMLPELRDWFNEQGYRRFGKFVLSDNFLEIVSGTRPTGNSLKAPVDALYRYGAIPGHMLSLEADMTWEQYMNPTRVTEAHKALGKEFLKRIGLAYEQVKAEDFLNALDVDMIDVAGNAWPVPVNGIYPKNDGRITHAFVGANPEIDVLDTYIPFVKRLAKDYIFFPWGYTISIVRQTVPEKAPGYEGILAQWISRFIQWLNGPRITPVPDVPEEPIKPVEPPKPFPVKPKYDWSTRATARHSVRVICDEEGLTVAQKNELCATVACESNFRTKITNQNKRKDGTVASTDWGIAQINDYYHIGKGKSFPSVEYVLDNPEAVIRWMCKQWKKGNAKLWVCFSKGMYLQKQHQS